MVIMDRQHNEDAGWSSNEDDDGDEYGGGGSGDVDLGLQPYLYFSVDDLSYDFVSLFE